MLAGRYTVDLSLHGDTLAALNENSGEIYLFERNFGGANAWGAKVLGGSGRHVSVEGNTLVVSGLSSGASVATRSAAGATDWQFTGFFSTPSPFYYQGASSLSGDTLAIRGEESTFALSRPKEIVIIRRRDQGGANQWGEVARLFPMIVRG